MYNYNNNKTVYEKCGIIKINAAATALYTVY